VQHLRLLVLGLKGRRTTLLWCRDRQNTWQTELAEEKPPELLRQMSLDLGSAGLPDAPRAVKFYDPWVDTWQTAANAVGELALPDFRRSLVVRIEHQSE
jgi:hypothetical protein